jgi:hypothetical protein
MDVMETDFQFGLIILDLLVDLPPDPTVGRRDVLVPQHRA